jgi:hypothetical protein
MDARHETNMFVRSSNAGGRKGDGNVENRVHDEWMDRWIGPQDRRESDQVRPGIILITVIFPQFLTNVLRNDELKI